MHLPLFFTVYIHFLKKTPSLDAPPGCPGPSHPLVPLSARHWDELVDPVTVVTSLVVGCPGRFWDPARPCSCNKLYRPRPK